MTLTLTRLRRWLADVLVRAAYRLDPHRPKVTSTPDGGHTILVNGTPLARVNLSEDGPVRARDVTDVRDFEVSCQPWSPWDFDPEMPRLNLSRPASFVRGPLRNPRDFADDLDEPEFDGPLP